MVRRSHLVDCGYTQNDIRAALTSGELERIRYGWYAQPGAHAGVTAAVRSGATVTCVSALSFAGVWSPVWFDKLHDVVHARRTEYREQRTLPLQPNVHICANVDRDARPCRFALDAIEDALISATFCQPFEWLVVLFESVLHLQRLPRRRLEELFGSGSSRAARALAVSSEQSESGAESLLQLGLRRRRVRFRQQVRIDRDRVDSLIGDRLVVEVDGEQFHSSSESFEADRARDRRLIAAGYIVVRVTYWQVMSDLDAVLDDICRIVQRGDHLFPRR